MIHFHSAIPRCYDIVHDVSCDSCNISKISNLRYSCMDCIHDLCTSCWNLPRRSHDATHLFVEIPALFYESGKITNELLSDLTFLKVQVLIFFRKPKFPVKLRKRHNKLHNQGHLIHLKRLKYESNNIMFKMTLIFHKYVVTPLSCTLNNQSSPE